MAMFKSVLVPLGGSGLSARALPFAKRVAQAAAARLIVVRAHLPADDLGLRLEYPELSWAERADEERATAEAEFRTVVDGLRKDGQDVEARFVEGAAADVIYETAASTRANLIVMSTHGHGGMGRWLYGSVADEVLRRVPVPVLLVSAVCTQSWAEDQPLRVVVPLDGSDLAAEALGPARDLAVTLGSELFLLAVVEPLAVYPYQHLEAIGDVERVETAQVRQYLDKVAAEQRTSDGPTIATRIAYGDAAERICAVAREVGAGTIAMATHGRSGMARLLLGSVATRTLHQSSVPVLIYRPVAVPQTPLEQAVEKIARPSASVSHGARASQPAVCIDR
jgi:nucleotide-binding universal stress UspA family protein